MLRLMRTSDVDAVAETCRRLLGHAEVGPVVWTGLGYLREQFGRARGRGVLMAQRNLEGVVPPGLVAGVATAYVRRLGEILG